jgi:uncharacterized phage protein gp47/JayE
MAYTRPTLTEIITRIEADMSARLLDGAPVLRRSFLGVLSRVFAGISHMLYGFIVWLSKQAVPGSDDNDADYLELHADTWGITRRAAAYATGNITVTGTTGAVVPAGSVLQRADGVTYETDAEATLAGGTATIAVTAITAGADGNAVISTVVSFVSAIDGVNSTATVATGGLTGGVDQETDDELRDRLQARLLFIPHGGAEEDYNLWALEVSGIYKAFVFPLYDQPNDTYPAPGHVGVTGIDSAGAVIAAGVVTALQTYLDSVAPVTAQVTAYAATPVAVNFNINLSPNTTAVRAAVEAEIEALFLREAAPNTTITLSHINEAISVASGEIDHALVAPSADIAATRAQIQSVGTFTFGTL